jgi:hypothetical protein
MVVGWFGLLVVDGWQSLAPNSHIRPTPNP